MKCEVKASKGRGVKRAGEGRRLSFGRLFMNRTTTRTSDGRPRRQSRAAEGQRERHVLVRLAVKTGGGRMHCGYKRAQAIVGDGAFCDGMKD